MPRDESSIWRETFESVPDESGQLSIWDAALGLPSEIAGTRDDHEKEIVARTKSLLGKPGTIKLDEH